VIHDDISMLFENSQSDKEVKAAAKPIRPERLPESQDVDPHKLSLVPHKQHTKEEEEVCAISSLEMEIELWIHQLNKLVECHELEPHSRLVSEKVPLLDVIKLAQK
jgi:hypothetical protein